MEDADEKLGDEVTEETQRGGVLTNNLEELDEREEFDERTGGGMF